MTHLFEPDLELEIALTGIGQGPRALSLALTLPLVLALVAALTLWRFRRAESRTTLGGSLPNPAASPPLPWNWTTCGSSRKSSPGSGTWPGA